MDCSTSQNPELKLADDFVRYTDHHIFLTGKAGTGKTTFLRRLKKTSAKRMIVTAPTGVAALNAQGVTLHSFFQLPFGPFIPGSEAFEKNHQRQYRFSKEKKRIIQSLDLLVIDEISMVRADLLDAVDATLQRHRRNTDPFGGVQLLMIGDLYQLPPVAKPEEWRLLQAYYESVYFFSSRALAGTELATIELKHVYRQSDPRFIQLLNQVRNNRLDRDAILQLNQRYIENYTPEEDSGVITLTTHNNSAHAINQNRQNALPGKAHCFDADISGDFPDHMHPTPASLVLKEGAQVMFLRNDTDEDKRYYNGKIGRITRISGEKIRVKCPEDSGEIVVEPVAWENIKYTLNPEKKEIQEDLIGKFKQYPLKLAWAITIHKSQGLTFEKAVIDAKAAFAHGQVYVALSRCRRYDGMVLSSPLAPRGVAIDPAILRFIEQAREQRPSENQLRSEQIRYQQKLLLDCFDFKSLNSRLNYLAALLRNNARLVQVSGVSDMEGLKQTAWKDIFSIGEKFARQLLGLFTTGALPESDAHILDRIRKASAWFQEKFILIFDDIVNELSVETDNKDLGRRINLALDRLRQEIAIKRAGVKSCEAGFSPGAYLRARSNAGIDFGGKKKKKTASPDYGESDIEHPELFDRLKNWRARKAGEEGVAHFQVMHQRVLIQIVIYLPDNKTALKNIRGVGKKTIEKYGEDLLAMVTAYREKHGITAVEPPAPKSPPEKKASSKKKKPVSDTRKASFDMFNKGLSIPEIAKERGLAASTILGHLSLFVERGELEIDKLVPPEKQQMIKAQLEASAGDSLKAVKIALGDDFSYGDITLVQAHLKALRRQ